MMTMEEVADDDNLGRAFAEVAANRGAPGADGRSIDEVREHLCELLPDVRCRLLDGTHRPGMIRRVWIPKPGGGQYGLGIPGGYALEHLRSLGVRICVMTRKNYGRRRRATCRRCGRTFRRTRPGHQFCSGACRQAAWVAQGGLQRASSHDMEVLGLKMKTRAPAVTHACPLCGFVHQAKKLRRRRHEPVVASVVPFKRKLKD
jgi:hypothetical protein